MYFDFYGLETMTLMYKVCEIFEFFLGVNSSITGMSIIGI